MWLWFLGIVAVLILLPLVLECFHALNWQLWGRVWCRQTRQLWGMVELVMLGMDQVSHCHSMMTISPRWVMLLTVGEERVVDLGRWHLQLVVLTLAVQEAIELGQAAQWQSMRDWGFGVFRQLLGLVACVITVAWNQEAREEGTKDKGHQNTSNQKSIMDTRTGFVLLWRSPHTLKQMKREKGTPVSFSDWARRFKKIKTFSRANIGQATAGTDRLCLQELQYVGNSMGEVFELSSWLPFLPLLIDEYSLSF